MSSAVPRPGEFLESEVLPKLSVDEVFDDSAHKWVERGGKTWKGGCPWHESKTGSSFVVDVDSLRWWCAGCQTGGGPIQYLWKKKGGSGMTPHGLDFVELVRELAAKVGVPFPEREMTEEEKKKARAREAKRGLLDVVVRHGEEVLWSPAGEAARAYLTTGRGFTDEDIRSLRLGYYDSVVGFREALSKAGVDVKDAEDTAVLWDKLEGYILIPWMDERGRPLTLYGRWKEKTPPEGRPKTIALPGEGSKRSPLYFDRARALSVREVVLVEGVFDAALLQARGDARVVASVAAQASHEQVETLARNRVKAVYICGDPDGGGDKGTLSNIVNLTAAGISTFVVPRLPDELDPDDFLRRHGMDAWRERVSRSVPGSVFRGTVALEGVDPTSPDKVKREAVDRVLAVLEDLKGEHAPLDHETILRETGARTGYTLETLLAVAAAHEKAAKKEEAAAIVREAVQKAGRDLEKRSDGGAVDLSSISRNLSKVLSTLQTDTDTDPVVFSVDRLWNEMEKTPPGRSSGWKALDELEVRFHAGELALLAARTGHAKTSVLVGLLWNWLRDSDPDETLLFYSHEEGEVPVTRRLLSLVSLEVAGGRGGWDRQEIRDYTRDAGSRASWPQRDLLTKARERLRDLEDRLFVVHRSGWTADDIAAHGLRLKDGGRRVGGVLVDYLQRIPVSEAASGGRRDIDISATARRLKTLSEELEAPVVMGGQINREAIPEKYSAKLAAVADYKGAWATIRTARPDLYHLREGGSEQEADLVVGLLNYAADYRTEANETTIPAVTRLEAGVLKNREGEAGRWTGLAFERRYGLVRDMDAHEKVDLRVPDDSAASKRGGK